MTLVPTIDLRRPGDEVAVELDRAAREVGFFQVVGHGIDPAVADAAWHSARRFFDLPLDEKLAVRIPDGDAYGYAPFRAERLAASLGQVTPPDLKETFSVGPFDASPGDVAGDPAAAFTYSPNLWPTALPEMPAAWEAYYRAMAHLAARVLALMGRALGLPDDHFGAFIDRHTSALRALRYPDLGGAAPEPGQLRAGAHSDYGTLTLLRQNDAPGGLEVRGSDGTWHPVPVDDEALVVNVGDALERWSNDRWRSTLHRVVVPPPAAGLDCTRQSLAFFHNANWDAVIECLPACSGQDNPPKYGSIAAGRHLMDKFRSTQGY
jgi:isopenicillin N synthase-like dioxygenase